MWFKLDITGHTTDTMVSAIIYKKIYDFLNIKWKKELFQFIKSVKVRQNTLTIKTEKPIVNSELKMFESDIKKIFIDACSWIWKTFQEIKIYLK